MALIRKSGYTVQRTGNDIVINCTIYMRVQDPTGTGLWTIANRIAFNTYVRDNIHSVWNSDYNRGLQLPFSRTDLTIRTNVTILDGLVVQIPRILSEGECIIDAYPFAGRDQVETISNRFWQKSVQQIRQRILRRGNFFASGQFVTIGGVSVYQPSPPPASPDYSYAHEFGHILGLGERYTYLSNCNMDDFSIPTRRNNVLSNPPNNIFPIYLPGYYDPSVTEPDSYSGVDLSLPQYNYDAITNYPNLPDPYVNEKFNLFFPNIFKRQLGPGKDVQTNYRQTPYDLDYSTRFGWMHNLMSRLESPNIDSSVLADGQNLFIGRIGTYDFLYQFSPDLTPVALLTPPSAAPAGLPVPNLLLMTGSATIAGSEKTIIITAQQINVVIDKYYIEELDHEKIFAKFKFVKALRQNIANHIEPIEDPSSSSNQTNKFIRQNGSFVGLMFDNYTNNFKGELTKNKLDTAEVVSDELFDSRFAYPLTLEFRNTGSPIAGFALVGGLVQITTNGPHNLNFGDLVTIRGVRSSNTPGGQTFESNVVNVDNNGILITGLNTFTLNGIVTLAGELFANGTNSKFTTNTQVVDSFGVNAATIAGAPGFEVLTITTSANHSFINGDFVTVVNLIGITTGAGTPGNLIFQQITVLALNQFSLAAPGAFGAYTGGGVVNHIRVNPGVDDFMDYRISKFNKYYTTTPKSLWKVEDDKFGPLKFFSLHYKFRAERYIPPFSTAPGGIPIAPWPNRITDLLTGNFRQYNLVRSRAVPKSNGSVITGSFVEQNEDRFSNEGYWKSSLLKDFWNQRINISGIPGGAISPLSPPPWWNFAPFNIPLPPNPPWISTGNAFTIAAVGGSLTLEIYLHRIDFIVLPE